MKQGQFTTSISLGMGKVGEKRKKLYDQGAENRGYQSLSAYIIGLMDKEFNVNLPKPRIRRRLRGKP